MRVVGFECCPRLTEEYGAVVTIARQRPRRRLQQGGPAAVDVNLQRAIGRFIGHFLALANPVTQIEPGSRLLGGIGNLLQRLYLDGPLLGGLLILTLLLSGLGALVMQLKEAYSQSANV